MPKKTAFGLKIFYHLKTNNWLEEMNLLFTTKKENVPINLKTDRAKLSNKGVKNVRYVPWRWNIGFFGGGDPDENPIAKGRGGICAMMVRILLAFLLTVLYTSYVCYFGLLS
jgi:hypothetical protein